MLTPTFPRGLGGTDAQAVRMVATDSQFEAFMGSRATFGWFLLRIIRSPSCMAGRVRAMPPFLFFVSDFRGGFG